MSRVCTSVKQAGLTPGRDNLLLQESQLRKLPRPSERVHRNFMDYIWAENPFGEDDQRFIFHEHDFVSLQIYQDSWLDQLMHRFLGHCKKGILRVSSARSRKYKTKMDTNFVVCFRECCGSQQNRRRLPPLLLCLSTRCSDQGHHSSRFHNFAADPHILVP